eukprot:CAMPEP_0197323480 /NCGR_PEP_ID=MMETSP0891-20130614/70547_1 /TAXON_ID=44058 ORGANISM="Aureoumbra lagunensis, Strain CCMP1510" /NCGR_SAMPLE_ID=MMETSP0891 /ASSEMBLY_ACC=CAM_ASM_000534 /LENGTH=552 /DNA_ID=CAMNT_0042816137 /DNA_START=632 /DNA_END=2290 /DNA_ORIENTATION=+
MLLEGAYRAAISVQKGNSRSITLENCLRSGIEIRLRHEDPLALKTALEIVPLDMIREKAFAELFPDNTNVSSLTKIEIKEATTCADGKTPRDAVARALLQWFKGPQFFRWLNKPDSCVACGANKASLELDGIEGPMSQEEITGLASRVEVYRCKQCNSKRTRFPRYNNPVTMLLSSRRGRCGEFANCFTLVCRAIGFEARYILDLTDHVWTEIWSGEQHRWLHADPCEKKLDRPLMYAKGWGKKLIAVFAFDRCQVSDVTRRYLAPGSVAACSERRIVHFGGLSENEIKNQVYRARLDISVQNDTWFSTIRERQETEAIEFCQALENPTADDVNDEQGRTTGDAEWIRSRGEDGLPNGSWKRSAESPHVESTQINGVSMLRASLRDIEGSLQPAEILVLDDSFQDDDLENINGTFRRSDQAWSRLLSTLARQLVNAARAHINPPDATEENMRRRHLKLCSNLKRSSLTKFSSLRTSNAIVANVILAPGQPAYTWLAFALGFLPTAALDAAQNDVLKVSVASSRIAEQASRAYEQLLMNWPPPKEMSPPPSSS